MSLQRVSAPRSNVGASQMVLVVKYLPVTAGDSRDVGSIPVLGRCPGEGNDYPLQYSCLESPMDRGAWQSTVHAVAKGWTQVNTQSTEAMLHNEE